MVKALKKVIREVVTRGVTKHVLNGTCIDMRVLGPNIYMYIK
jgi:hypothetical protein